MSPKWGKKLLLIIIVLVEVELCSFAYASEQFRVFIIDSHNSTSTFYYSNEIYESISQLSPLPRGIHGVLVDGENSNLDNTNYKKIQLMLSRSQLDHVVTYKSALNLWSSSDLSKKESALKEMQLVVDAFDPLLRLQLQVDIVILRMLLALERYSELRAYGEKVTQFLKTNNTIDSSWLLSFQWDINWAVADSYYKQHRVQEALDAYNTLLEKLEPRGDLSNTWILNKTHIKMLRATVMMLSGYAASEQKIIELALDEATRAQQLAKKYSDFKLAAQAANIRGLCYSLLNKFGQSEAAFFDSVAFHEKAAPSRDRSAPISNLADIYRVQGRLGLAIEMANKALWIEQQYSQKSDIAQVRLNLAELYIEVGHLDIAIVMAQEAASIFKQVDHRDGLANAYFQEAIALRILNTSDQMIKRAASLNRQALDLLGFYDGTGNDVTSHTRFLVELARDYFLQGKNSELNDAKLGLDRLLISGATNSGANNFIPTEIETRLFLAELALSENNLTEYSEQLELLETLFTASAVTNGRSSSVVMDSLSSELELVKLKLNYLQRFGTDKEIIENANNLKILLDHGNRQLDPIFLGPSWTQKVSKVLDQHFSALINRSNSQFSNEFWLNVLELKMDMGSKLLSIGRTNRHTNEGLENLQLIEKELVQNISPNLQDRNSLKLADAKIAWSSRENELIFVNKGEHGSFSDRINEVQSKLAFDEILLIYHVRKKTSFLLSISQDTVTGEVLDLEYIRSMGESYISRLESQSSNFLKASSMLAAALKLRKIDFDRFKKIVVQPSGYLFSLPLNSLNVADGDVSYRPLGVAANLILTFSIEDYVRKNDTSRDTRYLSDIAIFANPKFGNLENSGSNSQVVENKGLELRAWSKTLTQLPWTAIEARSIKDLYDDKEVVLSLGTHATADQLKSHSMRRARVLHIASHGYYDPSTPDIVGIATAETQRKGEHGFGFVSLATLASSNQYSNLVVISGCDTAKGALYEGEGTNSLSRGFLVAGAGSVLGSLWKVPDKPTSEFMKAFYRFLKESGGNAGEALQLTRSKLSRTGNFKHPYFWAGFELTSFNRSFDQAVFN